MKRRYQRSMKGERGRERSINPTAGWWREGARMRDREKRGEREEEEEEAKER